MYHVINEQRTHNASQHEEPPCSPVRWSNDHRHTIHSFLPGRIGDADRKRVSAGIQIEISTRRKLVSFLPRNIERFQPVSYPITDGIVVVGNEEAELKRVVVEGKLQLLVAFDHRMAFAFKRWLLGLI